MGHSSSSRWRNKDTRGSTLPGQWNLPCSRRLESSAREGQLEGWPESGGSGGWKSSRSRRGSRNKSSRRWPSSPRLTTPTCSQTTKPPCQDRKCWLGRGGHVIPPRIMGRYWWGVSCLLLLFSCSLHTCYSTAKPRGEPSMKSWPPWHTRREGRRSEEAAVWRSTQVRS